MRSLTTGLATAIFALSVSVSSAWAQADDNLRNPQLIAVEQEGAVAHFVVGDGAWGDILATMGAVRGASPDQNLTIIDQLWERRDINPPVFLFEVARRTAQSDPQRALEAYFLGRSRAMYDASRCIDSTAMAVVEAAANFAGEDIVAVMEADGRRLEAALRWVYESGQAYTGQASPWWACSYGDAAYFAAVNNSPMPGAEWLKTEILWAESRSQINDNMLGNLEIMRAGLAVQNN